MSDPRATAARLLASNGQAITLNYVGAGTYDPATGESTTTAPDPATVMGALLPLSMAIRYGFKNEPGSLIVEGDQQLLLSALDAAGNPIMPPQVNGTITDAASKPWTIIAMDPLSPAGTDILYDCVVRRAA